MRELEFLPDSFLQPTSDKMAFIDRLTNSITKRKRSTPQKFVGENRYIDDFEIGVDLLEMTPNNRTAADLLLANLGSALPVVSPNAFFFLS